MKVSGGTQTDMKSYSVSGPSATQLSQSVRERLMANQSEQEAKISSPYGTWMRHSPVPPHYTASLPSRTGAIGTYLLSLVMGYFVSFSELFLTFQVSKRNNSK